MKKLLLILLTLSLTGCFETSGEDDGPAPVLDPGGGVTYPPTDGDTPGDDDGGNDDDKPKDDNGLTDEEKQFDTATFDEARFT